MLRFGAALYWGRWLPAGWRMETRPDVADFIGWTDEDRVFTGHFAKAPTYSQHVRDSVEGYGIQPRTHWNRFAQGGERSGPVVLCRYAPRAQKHWGDERWMQLCAMLNAARVPWEYEDTGTLHDLEAQFSRARGAVAIDSGPMHLAAFMGIPVTTIFVSTPADFYAPPRAIALTNATPQEVFASLPAALKEHIDG